jgi:imidazolonepropionase-like amidohydrolase
MRTFFVAVVVLIGGVAGAQRPVAPPFVLQDVLIYASPLSEGVLDGVVVVRDGLVAAVGPRASVPVPEGARVIDAAGGVVVAGFQNSHVHFTEPKWAGAAAQPAEKLSAQMRDMLTRWGFTTVVDTGSLPGDTLALRGRIEAGDIDGPRILTAGIPLYPPSGIPYYLRDGLPPDLLRLLPQPATTDAATREVAQHLENGADVVKLFTGSWITNQRVLPMPQDVATAAAAEAHRRSRLVFAHPSNVAGLEVAVAAGVDVLAHALDETDGLTEAHLARAVGRGVAMVPTLTLFRGAPDVVAEVRDFHRIGGQLLFGTDVGYHDTYDTTREFELLAQAGLSWRDVLAMLTTNPAGQFGEREARGAIAPGMAADLVVLGRDPSTDVRAFSDVRMTILSGRVMFQTN